MKDNGLDTKLATDVFVKTAVGNLRWRIRQYEAALREGGVDSEASRAAWITVQEALERASEAVLGDVAEWDKVCLP